MKRGLRLKRDGFITEARRTWRGPRPKPSEPWSKGLNRVFPAFDRASFALERDFGPVGGFVMPAGGLVDQLQFDGLAGKPCQIDAHVGPAYRRTVRSDALSEQWLAVGLDDQVPITAWIVPDHQLQGASSIRRQVDGPAENTTAVPAP